MTGPVEAMAERARREPFFLGFVLERYAQAERLDDAGLAAALGCAAEALAGLRLCRAPRADAAGFREDVRRVAEAFALDPVRLAEVVKRSAVLGRLQEQAARADAPGLMMAARDRDGGQP
jgi:hypothetical protein